MKFHPIFSIVLYFFFTPLLGQAELSPRLLEKMGRTAATEMIEARICLPDTLNRSLISAHWDGTAETEDKIKEMTKATIRCIPFDNPKEEGACILTGNPSNQRVLFAKAY